MNRDLLENNIDIVSVNDITPRFIKSSCPKETNLKEPQGSP